MKKWSVKNLKIILVIVLTEVFEARLAKTQVNKAVTIPAKIITEAITIQTIPALCGPSPHSLKSNKIMDIDEFTNDR